MERCLGIGGDKVLLSKGDWKAWLGDVLCCIGQV